MDEEINIYGTNITAVKQLIKDLQELIDKEPNVVRAVSINQEFENRGNRTITTYREIKITLTK